MLGGHTKISPFRIGNCYGSLKLFIYFQLQQLSKRLWDRGNLIATEMKLCQIGQLPQRLWDGGYLIVIEVKLCQIGQLTEGF